MKFEAEGREFAKILKIISLEFQKFSRSQEQFFLTVRQNNFGNKIPLFISRTSLQKDNFDDDHLLEILRTKDTQVTFKFLFCKGQKISEAIFLFFQKNTNLS